MTRFNIKRYFIINSLLKFSLGVYHLIFVQHLAKMSMESGTGLTTNAIHVSNQLTL